MANELSIVEAARRFKISKPTILTAIRKGKIPAQIITVSQIRVRAKDVAAHVATMSEWRRNAGRLGGFARAANWRARNLDRSRGSVRKV